MRRDRRSRLVGLVGATVLVVALFLGGVVTRAAADVIYACVATKDGAVRIVGPTGSCDPKKENATQWNSQGPQGDPGLLGSFDDLEGLPCTTAAGAAGTVKLVGGLKNPVCTVGVYEGGRFADLGPVVFDTQTNLMWEKKVAGSGCLHCVGDTYTWCNATGIASVCAVTNNWIAAVNAEVFAGFTDWRVPTRDELAGLLLGPFPCDDRNPCIDPIFDPTASSVYWSATEVVPNSAWFVNFANSVVNFGLTNEVSAARVRAVRGP